jgi:hypothetical protein
MATAPEDPIVAAELLQLVFATPTTTMMPSNPNRQQSVKVTTRTTDTTTILSWQGLSAPRTSKLVGAAPWQLPY